MDTIIDFVSLGAGPRQKMSSSVETLTQLLETIGRQVSS